MADSNNISVQITAQIADLISGLNESANAVKSSADQMKSSFEELKASSEKSSNAIVENLKGIKEQADSAVEGIKGLVETLGLLEGIHLAFEFIKGGAEIAEKLDLLSKSTGLSAEELSRLKFVAEESGLSIDEVGMAVNRMNLRMAEMVRTGTGPMKAGLQDLHIDAVAFQAANAAERFAMLGDAMNRFGNTPRALGDLGEVIGRSGGRMTAFVESIREGEAESDKLGATLSGPVVEAADRFSDATKNLGSQWDALKTTVTAALAGPLTAVVNVIEDIVQHLVKLANNGSLEQWGKDAAGAVLDFIQAAIPNLEELGKVVMGVVDALNMMGKLFHSDFLQGMALGGAGMMTGLGVEPGKSPLDAKIDQLRAAINASHGPIGAGLDASGSASEDQGPQAASTAAVAAAKKAAEEAKRATAEAFAEFVLEQKLEIAEAGNTATAKIAAYQKVYTEAVALFKAGSKEARAAAVEEAQAVNAGLKEQLKNRLDNATNAQTIAKGALALQQAQDAQGLAAATSAARLRLAMGMETKQQELADLISIGGQELAAEQTIENQKFANAKNELQNALAALQQSGLAKTEEINKNQRRDHGTGRPASI
jgi:hypothetical protein